ncbi:MAG: AMP-binding protein [Endozoicomonas sp.]
MTIDFWDGKRPPGVPSSINLGRYTSLLEVIETSFEQFQDKDAFTCLGKTLTFAEMDALSLKLSAWLQNHTNLKPGDAIAIQLPNLLQYPVAAYAAIRAGLVIVNTNPLYTLTELKHQLNDSEAKAVICLDGNLETVLQASGGSQVEQIITTGPVDLITDSQVNQEPTASGGITVTPLLNALEQGQTAPYSRPPAANQNSLAMLQYTGGTTGVAKGAMLTHGNIIANIVQYESIYKEQDSDGNVLVPAGKQVVVAPLPIYHIYSFTMCLMVYPSRGDHSILIPNPRDMDQFVAAIKPFRFTLLVGLNTLFIGLMAHPDFARCDFSSLRLTLSGGTALKQDVYQRWKEFTGCPALEGYGLTETSPVVSVSPFGEGARIGTVGIPVPGTEIKTVHPDGTQTRQGEPGELCVRGPQVMAGYWKRPEATAEVIDQEGWFHTGDVAEIDPDGHIRIVDRLKDVILVSGFNVYPNEIEDVVSLCNAVQSCAVIGVPDDKTGEAVRLYVVSSDESLTQEKILEHCRQHLTAYKLPRQLLFRQSLPLTAVGKVLRKDLKKEAEAELAEA